MLLTPFSFQKRDAFVGFQPDTPAAVIFQVTKMKREELKLMQDSSLSDYHEDILARSCSMLLQMASPDALIRLKYTPLKNEQQKLCEIYFEEQKHDSLVDFMENQFEKAGDDNVSIQVSILKISTIAPI